SALQLFPIGSNNYIGAEVALLPNSVYFNPLDPTFPIAASPFTIPGSGAGAPPVLVEPFLTSLQLDQFGKYTAGKYWPLNNFPVGTALPIPAAFLYPSYVGSGGPNEGYDAADFQNMFLALQTVTPRSQGRVVHSDGANPPLTLDVNDPAVWNGT